MKRVGLIIIAGLGLVFAGLLYSANFSITIPDAHATIITNRVIILNAANGTSLTVLNLIDKYGIPAITNDTTFVEIARKERQLKDRTILNNYHNGNISTKNSVDSALGISD